MNKNKIFLLTIFFILSYVGAVYADDTVLEISCSQEVKLINNQLSPLPKGWEIVPETLVATKFNEMKDGTYIFYSSGVVFANQLNSGLSTDTDYYDETSERYTWNLSDKKEYAFQCIYDSYTSKTSALLVAIWRPIPRNLHECTVFFTTKNGKRISNQAVCK